MLYKFYIDFSCKSYRKDVLKTYKQIDSTLKKKVNLKTNQKSKSGLRSLKVSKVEDIPVPLDDIEEPLETLEKPEEKPKKMKKISKKHSEACQIKKLRFEENLNYSKLLLLF